METAIKNYIPVHKINNRESWTFVSSSPESGQFYDKIIWCDNKIKSSWTLCGPETFGFSYYGDAVLFRLHYY